MCHFCPRIDHLDSDTQPDSCHSEKTEMHILSVYKGLQFRKHLLTPTWQCQATVTWMSKGLYKDYFLWAVLLLLSCSHILLACAGLHTFSLPYFQMHVSSARISLVKDTLQNHTHSQNTISHNFIAKKEIMRCRHSRCIVLAVICLLQGLVIWRISHLNILIVITVSFKLLTRGTSRNWSILLLQIEWTANWNIKK